MPAPPLYRLPDAALWALLVASGLFCLGHAVARSLGRRASASPDVTPGRHTAFQRVFHWANALLVAIFTVSGLAIYTPGSMGGPGLTTAFWFSWHVWVVWPSAALVAAHVVFEYRAPGGADTMWPGRGRPGKYSRAQVFYHWAIASNILALALTGAVLWKPLRALVPLRLLGLGWDVVFVARVVHGLLTATLVALVLAHVYFALLVPENQRRARSMLLDSDRA